MTSNEEPSAGAAPIKARTREGYLKSINTAIKHSTTKRTLDWEEPAIVTLTQVVGDLIEREDLAGSTKNAIRAALLWYIKSGETPRNEDSIKALELLGSMTMPRGPKPSITRPKSIPEQDLAKLLDEIYLRADRSSWALRCAVWIHAALASGARPIEWLDAEWVDESQTSIRIRNAKIKLMAPAFLRKQAENDEDNALLESLDYWDQSEEVSHRIVPLSKESERSMVDTQLQYIAEFVPRSMSQEARRQEFAKYYAACRLVISRACRKIWGNKKAYSLYTMRSQFSANMSAAHGAGSTASLMGHSGADSPSAAHYGKWNQAHSRFKSKGGDRPGQVMTVTPANKTQAAPQENKPIE